MVIIEVDPGICGLKSSIHVKADEEQTAAIEIVSACPHIRAMGEAIKEVDGYSECFAKFGDSEIYKAAHKYCRHPACPVPCAVLKAVEAACGLALPRNVSFTIEKIQD